MLPRSRKKNYYPLLQTTTYFFLTNGVSVKYRGGEVIENM